MPLIIKSRLVPKNFCVNLFGTLWTRDTGWIDKHVVNHEMIHTAQQRELLFVPFYLLYCLEWLWLLCRLRSLEKAYLSISFEREAYAHGYDLGYLSRRKHFAMWRHAANSAHQTSNTKKLNTPH